jgi:spore germination protein KB
MSVKGNISAVQMGMMVFPVIVATADLLVPAITAKYAERDMWISPLWASLIGYLTVYLVYYLHSYFPGQSIIQYSPKIIGVIPGKVVGFIVLYDLLYSNGNILRQYGEFIVGSFLFETPLIVVIGTIALVCAMTVRAGIEVLARAAQVFVPIVVLFYLVLLILMIPFMKVENIFPVLANGVTPSLLGAVTPQGWFSEFILFSFLLPFVTDRERGMRMGISTVVATTIALFAINISTLLVLEGEVSHTTYPFFTAVQIISFADFFENLDSVVMAIWVSGAFIKISVFYFALAIGTAQWLKMDDYRPIVFPLGFLLVVFSFWTAPNLSELSTNIGKIAGFQTTSVFTCIPLLLWIIAKLRRRREESDKVMAPPSNK